jgi:hypothetical protein
MSDLCPRCGGVEPLTIQVGTTLVDCPHPWHTAAGSGRDDYPRVGVAQVSAIQRDAETRIAELETVGGCEAGAARAFEEGRLAVLRLLGLWRDMSPAEVSEQRRRDQHGCSRPTTTPDSREATPWDTTAL